jgi:hypothetical protein
LYWLMVIHCFPSLGLLVVRSKCLKSSSSDLQNWCLIFGVSETVCRFTENNVGNRTGNSSSGSAAANVTASKEPSTGVHTTVSSDFVATRAALIDTGHH